MDYDGLLTLATDLGYGLLVSGAEIYRAEESVTRLLLAYGVAEPQVFAIPNCVIVSIATPEGHPITRMRRIAGHGTDIERTTKMVEQTARRKCVRDADKGLVLQSQIDELSELLYACRHGMIKEMPMRRQ